MKKWTFAIVALLIGAYTLSVVPGATAKVTPDNCMETEFGTWCSETVLSETQKFDGLNAGDVDGDGQAEVVSVGLSAKVWVADYKDHAWVSQMIWEAPGLGELLLPAIGDADNDGVNEIVVVGMVAGPEADTGAGQVTMLKKSGNSWVATRIHTDGYMVHGVDIGDADPDHPGNEVVVGTFGYNMTLLSLTGTTWSSQVIFKATHKIRTVLIGDADNDGKNEITAASKDKNLYIVEKSGQTWLNQSIFKDAGGEARVAIGDYDGDGITDVAGSGDAKNLSLVKRSGTTWSGSVIFTDSDQMRGAQIADVYNGHAGKELVGAGYSGNVTMHFQVNSAWKHQIVFHDTGRLHDVKVADVNPDHPGLELITCGYSNKVTVIGQYEPNFSVDVTPKGQTVVEQSSVSFKATITSKDFYTDNLNVVVEGLPTGATATLSASTVALTSAKAVVTITVAVPATVANGNTTFKVKVTGVAGIKTVDCWLKVDRAILPKVTGPGVGLTAKKGASVTYTFTIENKGNMPDSYDINATSASGWVLTTSMATTPVIQPGANVTVSVTMTVAKNTKVKEDVLTVKAKSKFDGTTTNSATVTTKVKEETTPGPCGIIWVGIILAIAGIGAAGYLRPRRR